jgi:hypothetical protein
MALGCFPQSSCSKKIDATCKSLAGFLRVFVLQWFVQPVTGPVAHTLIANTPTSSENRSSPKRSIKFATAARIFRSRRLDLSTGKGQRPDHPHPERPDPIASRLRAETCPTLRRSLSHAPSRPHAHNMVPPYGRKLASRITTAGSTRRDRTGGRALQPLQRSGGQFRHSLLTWFLLCASMAC